MRRSLRAPAVSLQEWEMGTRSGLQHGPSLLQPTLCLGQTDQQQRQQWSGLRRTFGVIHRHRTQELRRRNEPGKISPSWHMQQQFNDQEVSEKDGFLLQYMGRKMNRPNTKVG